MRVIKRSEGLSYTVAIRRQKEMVVLNWIAEHRVTSREIVRDLLGLSDNLSYKLLSDMERDNLVCSFANDHTRGYRLYCLTKHGKEVLELAGIEAERAVVKASNLSRNTRILHDLSVQSITIGLIEKLDCIEVRRELRFDDSPLQIDAVLTTKDRVIVALEFDRTAKSAGEFYERIVELYRLIVSGRLGAVFIASSSDATLERYQEYFEKNDWPKYKRMQSKKLIKMVDHMVPDSSIKSRFTFVRVEDSIRSILLSGHDLNWAGTLQ